MRRKEKGASTIIRKKGKISEKQNEWGNERTGIRVVAKMEAYKYVRPPPLRRCRDGSQIRRSIDRRSKTGLRPVY